MGIIREAGGGIAFPSQTMYLAAHSSGKLNRLIPEFAGADRSEDFQDERDLHH